MKCHHHSILVASLLLPNVRLTSWSAKETREDAFIGRSLSDKRFLKSLLGELQLLFTCPTEGQHLKWSSYVWRRGTVPIWWGVELKSGGVGEAIINVNSRSPYKGTRRSAELLIPSRWSL